MAYPAIAHRPAIVSYAQSEAPDAASSTAGASSFTARVRVATRRRARAVVALVVALVVVTLAFVQTRAAGMTSETKRDESMSGATSTRAARMIETTIDDRTRSRAARSSSMSTTRAMRVALDATSARGARRRERFERKHRAPSSMRVSDGRADNVVGRRARCGDARSAPIRGSRVLTAASPGNQSSTSESIDRLGSRSNDTSGTSSSPAAPAPAPLTPPNASQRRVIDQMITLRTRLNERVAKANAFAKFLEKTLVERDADLVNARRALARAAMEAETLRGLAEDARRGNGAPDALIARLDRMAKALKEDADDADAHCLRQVPVAWQGNASDVRLMGSFDDWTRGFHLSPEWHGHGDGMSDTFACTCLLPPGTYEVKFLVDGEWRTTDDWKTVGEGFERNMLLEVR